MIDAIANAYFQGNEIVIFTKTPKKSWGDLKIFLDDHGILFDKIKKKPLESSHNLISSANPQEFIKTWKQNQNS